MTIALSILIVAILLGAAGQISIKSGLNELERRTASGKPSPVLVVKSIFTQWQVTAGFLCYGVSSLLYLVALSRLQLSYAYPLIALSYVVVTFLSWKVLHEAVPTLRVAGLAVICVGVVIVAMSYSHAAAAAPQTPPAIERPAGNGP